MCALSPNRPQITQIYTNRCKTEPRIAQNIAEICRAGASPVGHGNRSGCPTMNRNAALRPSHVGACAGIDFNRLAFLDEKRHVNSLAGFEFCWLGDVTGSVAAQTFR